MTRQARARINGQLALALDEEVPPQVEAARAVRRAVGLPDSLTSPEVLAKARTILDGQHQHEGQPGAAARRAS